MIIRAGTSSFHTVSFFDEYSTPVTPSAAAYKVTDIYTGTVIKDTTALSPSTPWEIVPITDTENTVVTPGNLLERHNLHITFTYGGTKKGVADQVFVLNNGNVTVEDVMTDLEGWKLDTDDPSRYDVSEDMVETYIVKAMIKTSQELGLPGPNSLPSNIEVIDDAILDWAAGLLWRWKYTVNSPDLSLLPYGDDLISNAKTNLKVFIENNPDLLSTSTTGIGSSVNTELGEYPETAEYYKTRWDE